MTTINSSLHFKESQILLAYLKQSEDEKLHKVVEETFPESKEEQSLVQSSDDIKEELKKSDVNVESVEAQNPRPEENVIKEKQKVLTKRGKKKTKEPLKEATIEDEAEDSSSSSSSSASSSSDSSSDSEDESANNVSNLGKARLDQVNIKILNTDKPVGAG